MDPLKSEVVIIRDPKHAKELLELAKSTEAVTTMWDGLRPVGWMFILDNGKRQEFAVL